MDDFEKQLQRQPLRQVPADWRAEILQKSDEARNPSFVIRHSFLSALNSRLSTLLWPHPKAWAGLAAVWVLIFAFHFAARDTTPQMASASTRPASEISLGLKEQQQVLAELIGAAEPAHETEPPKRTPAQPHTERRRTTAMA